MAGTHSLLSRRSFLAGVGTALAGGRRLIDIHQHTNYHLRSNADLVAHQRGLGVTKTVLLPAGSRYGLAAQAGGNESVFQLARQFPNEFVFFANEVSDLPEARRVIEQYLKLGARGIGEQKFGVAVDSPHIELMARLAAEYGVPLLLHFQDGTYNDGFTRFPGVVRRHPKTVFIGHAQTWWAHIDAAYDGQSLYPKGRVKAGGLTDRLLSDYPNVYADLSAGSGLNALLRDEDHARAFLQRHRKKLLYGSDCADCAPRTGECTGWQQLEAIGRLAPKEALPDILYNNAARLLRLEDAKQDG